MLEFCEKCGSMMYPSKDSEEHVLICSLCNNIVEISEEVEQSYIFNKKIEHQEDTKI